MVHAVLLLAAGRGSRVSGHLADKVLAPLGHQPVIAHSAQTFRDSGLFRWLAVSFRDEEQQRKLAEAVARTGWKHEDLIWVRGGDERQESVLRGLRALPDSVDLVFIHDAARPLIRAENLTSLAESASKNGAACLSRRVTDTIKEVTPAGSGSMLRTLDRSRLWAMETPQVFRRSVILDAYEAIDAAGISITDDTAALERSGIPVALVENPFPNPKLTTPADLPYLEYLLRREETRA